MMEPNRTSVDGFGWSQNQGMTYGGSLQHESVEEAFLKMQQQQQLMGIQQSHFDQSSAFSQQWPSVMHSQGSYGSAGVPQQNTVAQQLNLQGLPLYTSGLSQMIPGMQMQALSGQQQGQYGLNQVNQLSSMIASQSNAGGNTFASGVDANGFGTLSAFTDVASADNFQQRYQKMMLQQLLLQQAQQESANPFLQQSYLTGGQSFVSGADVSALAAISGGGHSTSSMQSFMHQNRSLLPGGGMDSNVGMHNLASSGRSSGLLGDMESGVNSIQTGLTNGLSSAPSQITPSAGKGRRKTAKNKRDKNRPKQPLSAYNIFFKDQRAKMLVDLQKSSQNSKGDEAADEEDVEDEPSNGSIGNSNNEPSSRKRSHEASSAGHGKIGFEKMAKTIAKKWKEIDKDDLAKYEQRAQEDQKRYKAELAVYLQKKREESHSEKDALNTVTSAKDESA